MVAVVCDGHPPPPPVHVAATRVLFSQDLENVQEVDGLSYTDGGDWNSKSNTVYFRGRPSNAVRIEAMHFGQDKPEYDIRITKNHFNYFPNEQVRHFPAQFPPF